MLMLKFPDTVTCTEADAKLAADATRLRPMTATPRTVAASNFLFIESSSKNNFMYECALLFRF
jgi:hypothetical protein